jgi:hypothetical protein
MDPNTGLDFGSVYTTVGSVLGTPCALACFWVVSKIKELQTKVKILEEENSASKVTLTKILTDVSFIRGVIEGKESANSTVLQK